MLDVALAHFTAADATLAHLVRSVGDCGLLGTAAAKRTSRTLYAALVEAVVYQQLSGKAASTILGRVKALYPGKRFPAPEALLATPDADLRAAGLSRAKTAAVKDIAAKTLDGTVPTRAKIRRMTDSEIVERLTVIRGVGPWTVEMLLIFTLRRPDVLPATDYGVRKGFAAAYGRADLPTSAELLAHGERWRPYRSIATWYLWRAADAKPS